jgi:hypothetical protein
MRMGANAQVRTVVVLPVNYSTQRVITLQGSSPTRLAHAADAVVALDRASAQVRPRHHCLSQGAGHMGRGCPIMRGDEVRIMLRCSHSSLAAQVVGAIALDAGDAGGDWSQRVQRLRQLVHAPPNNRRWLPRA